MITQGLWHDLERAYKAAAELTACCEKAPIGAIGCAVPSHKCHAARAFARTLKGEATS